MDSLHNKPEQEPVAITRYELLKMTRAAGLEEEFLVDPQSEQRFRLFAQIAVSALAQPEPVEISGVKETLEEGGGIWCECTGCYETNEGYPPKGAYFSKVFKCHLGNGCDECGGIGAIWDTTDYEELAKFMMEDDTTPPQRTAAEGEDTRRAWVGLTDEEIRHIYICTTGWSISDSDPMLIDFAEAIEAKLKEKNK